MQQTIQGHGGRDALREAVLSKLQRRQSINPGEVEAQRSRLAELDAKIDLAAENYLAAPNSIRGDLARKMESMRADRDRAATELAAIEGFQPTDVEAEADRIVDRVWKLGDELERAKPARLRELISQLVEKIELFFGSVEKKTRTEHPLVRGRIVLRSDPSLCVYQHVSRGECRSFEPLEIDLHEVLAPFFQTPEAHVVRAAQLASFFLPSLSSEPPVDGPLLAVETDQVLVS